MDIVFNDKQFKQRLKLYKKSPANDKHVFNIIEIAIGNKEGNLTDLHDEVTIIDENLLTKNEKDIAFKLAKIKGNKGYLSVYEKLQEKFNDYKKLQEKFTDYKKLKKINNELLVLLNKYYNLDIDDIHEKYKVLYTELIYSLIELKVNLGLDLRDISIFDITWYCILMYNDIVNNDYQTLAIDQHLDSETGEVYIDKQLLKRKSPINN